MTKATRHQGLSGRESIPEDGGMLFVFPYERELTFVMRDCLVPIDIAFVAPGGRVLATHEMPVEPEESRANPDTYYASRGKALFAIELAEGTLDRLGLKPGDRVKLPEMELKGQAR